MSSLIVISCLFMGLNFLNSNNLSWIIEKEEEIEPETEHK